MIMRVPCSMSAGLIPHRGTTAQVKGNEQAAVPGSG